MLIACAAVVAAVRALRRSDEPSVTELAPLANCLAETQRRGVARWQPAAKESASADRLTLGAEETLAIPLHLPRRPVLRFGVEPAGQATALRVSLRTDDGQRDLEPTPDPSSGEWVVSLGGADARIAALELENRARRRSAVVRPRISGENAARSAPLAPPATAPRPPNVVLYVTDTLRADHLSAYGYQRKTSPHLDALAARGTLFWNAYATGPSTLHSLPSLFTSRLASTLGAGIRAAPWTLAELFRRAGYRTGGFQANPWVSGALGFGRGFDRYAVFEERDAHGKQVRVPAERLHDAALQWLREDEGHPFFLFVQNLDVHMPYDPPEPFRTRFHSAELPAEPRVRRRQPIAYVELQRLFERAVEEHATTDVPLVDLYDGAIAYVDHEIGKLVATLEELGVLDETILLLTSDHGEALGNLDDGTHAHGHSLYEPLVRVPMILVRPDVARPVRVTEPVSLLDVAPTLAALAGLPVPADAQGRSLVTPYGEAGPPPTVGELLALPSTARMRDTLAAGETSPVSAWFARHGPWKAIATPERIDLFHLPTDPFETEDRSAELPVTAAYLASSRCRVLPTRKPPSAVEREAGLDEEQVRDVEQALRTLGYIE
ncbi:MAG TPA: sulfatase [Candidatus Binatia bacterium]